MRQDHVTTINPAVGAKTASESTCRSEKVGSFFSKFFCGLPCATSLNGYFKYQRWSSWVICRGFIYLWNSIMHAGLLGLRPNRKTVQSKVEFALLAAHKNGEQLFANAARPTRRLFLLQFISLTFIIIQIFSKIVYRTRKLNKISQWTTSCKK